MLEEVISRLLDPQVIAALVFIVFLIVFTYVKRKKIQVQKLVFPLFYLILYRSKTGLGFMERVARKYREFLKIVGYSCIGLGFAGMIWISLSILFMLLQLFISPDTAESGMALVLPFTTVPGIGYLPFLYWILSIFIIVVVHEASHGIMARVHDVKLRSSGLAFMSVLVPIIPAAFVEPDEKQLQKMPDTVQYSVFSAGPISNVVLALLVLVIWSLVIVPVEAGITEPIGFRFNIENQSLPAARSGLEEGMIITSYQGEDIAGYEGMLYDLRYCKSPGDHITVGSEDEEYNITLTSSPQDSSVPLMGIETIENVKDVKPEYAAFKPVFYWIKGFLKWLGLLSFFIGMANLLPLAILDGGRMSDLALKRIVKDRKKANKIFTFISLLFLAALFFGLMTSYIGNPFMFIK
ncbi:hypothetical protein GF351_06605 [Candidatus Woesearchaeota archaeon]|nr:hypothetical protein [Candidatus Woesearchaeota archaeon]